MISYYGYTISPNQIETGEGFLICKNVPVARTGTQLYTGAEIELTGPDEQKVFKVFRPPEEVFSSAALASFEGKPVTNDHPPSLIGPEDVEIYEKGHVQNIRRGSGEWADYVIADLHIHSQELIDAIRNGKRDISCGYECDYIDNGDETYTQKNIRGNHIAVVERGRAGKRAAILDSDISKTKDKAIKPERKKMSKLNSVLHLFGLAASGKTSEEIQQLAMDTADAIDTEASPVPASEPAPAGPAEKKEEAPPAFDEAALDGLLDKLLERMAVRNNAKDEDDPLDAAIKKLSETKEETEPPAIDGEAQVVPAEEMDKSSLGMDQETAAGILKSMRPVVAGIKDEKQRKAVADALIRCVTADGEDDISKLVKISQNNARKAAADNAGVNNYDEIQKLYDAMNPHKTGKENR